MLWIDAVCINQADIPEKENQIQLMRMIYGYAGNVVVWLGEEADKSDDALKFIRLMAEVREDGIEGYDDVYDSEEESISGDDDGDGGEGDDTGGSTKAQYTIVLAPKKPQRPTRSDEDHRAVLKLLRRPWFRRIWVLQEVGLARSIQIMCGPVQTDGYVFSAGVGNSGISFSDDPELKAVAASVVTLMKAAIFRPPYTPATSSGSPLADLLNMYLRREATQRHNKVYALLGLCKEDLEVSGLLPDYSISWTELQSRLIRLVFGTKVVVETRKGIALVRGTGHVFGHVSSTHRDRTRKGRQYVKVWHNMVAKSMGLKLDFSVGMPAVPVERYDIVCHLGDSSRLWVIRRVEDYFIIITSVPGLETFSTQVQANRQKNPLLWGNLYLRELFLAWDLSPERDSEASLTGDDGILRYRGSERAIAKHYHAMALVHSDGERGAKGKEPHEVIKTIRMLELAFGETHDEPLTAWQDLALLYVTRQELKRADDTMRGVIRTKARMSGRHHPRTLDSLTILATILMFYSFLAGSSSGPEHLARLAVEPWEVAEQSSRILKKIQRRRKFTEEDVMGALKCFDGEGLTRLLELLFRRSNRRELVTDDVVKAVAGSVTNRREVMKFLLDQLGDDLPLSEDVVKEVVKDHKNGVEMLELLISRRGKDLPLSEEVVRLAAGNQLPAQPRTYYKDGTLRVETLQIPFHQILNLLESRRETLPITEDVLMEAANNSETGCLMMRNLAWRLGDSFTIPEAVLVKAVKSWPDEQVEDLMILITRQWDQASIPESILVAAAKHYSHGVKLLRGLLGETGDELSVTTDVIFAAATNYVGSNAVNNLKLIGEKRRNIAISEQMMTAVIDRFRGDLCSIADVIELLLKDESFVVSEQAVEIILNNISLPRDDELISTLFESRKSLRISQRLQDRIGALGSSRIAQ
ncbi:heterokaryon incompatibility protein-domain-containing protein [Aspergillus floccosus]